MSIRQSSSSAQWTETLTSSVGGVERVVNDGLLYTWIANSPGTLVKFTARTEEPLLGGGLRFIFSVNGVQQFQVDIPQGSKEATASPSIVLNGGETLTVQVQKLGSTSSSNARWMLTFNSYSGCII